MALRGGRQSARRTAERQGCALFLADHWPEKVSESVMFTSVTVEQDTREAEIAELDALRAEVEAKGHAVMEGSWGYGLEEVGGPCTTP